MKRPWLAPLVPLYQVGLAWRDLRLQRGAVRVRRLQWPVISIGNLSTGGSGKTPFAITLAKLLVARGIRVDVLSRGYGRASQLPVKVDSTGTSDQFGDEPLLIARTPSVPVYVAAQRYDAGLLAEADADSSGRHDHRAGRIASAHILDDGFQHRQLDRDVDILLLNREDWQDSLLPAGNLREALRAAKRADVLAIPADDTAFERELTAWGWQGPIWRLHRRMQVPSVEGPVFAFCGIARPDQFFRGLQQAGMIVAARSIFPDHYRYTRRDIETLVARARAALATALLSTEKDQIRLGALASGLPAELPLMTARLSVEIEDAEAALRWLAARLASPSVPSPL